MIKKLSALGFALLLLHCGAARAQGIAGYTLVDSTAAFSSIARTGTRLAGLVLDDTSERVDLPFVFRFGGVEYSHIMVASNAQIGLGDSCPTSTGFFTTNLNNMDIIVPLGHDQNMDPTGGHGGGNAYWQVTGTSPNRRMIIEYNRVLPYTGYDKNRYTFQVHLIENGDIWFHYDTMTVRRRQSDNYTFLRSHATGTALFVSGTWDSIVLRTTADTMPLSTRNKPMPGRCLVFHSSPCAPAAQFEATATGGGVTLTWQTSPRHIGYEVEYGTHGFEPGHGISISLPRGTTSHHIANLSIGNIYDFYITPLCGETWVAPSRMAVASLPCYSLSGLATVSSESAVFVSWDAINGATYRLEYGPRDFVRGSGTQVTGIATAGYILRDLQPATVYDIYVEPLCPSGMAGNGMMCSAALAAYESTCDTAASFTAVPSGSSAIMAWTPAGGGSAVWQLEYGPAGFRHGSGTLIAGIATTTYQILAIEDTAIDVYLRAQCSDSLYSDWSAPRRLSYPKPLGIDEANEELISISPNPVPQGTPITITLTMGQPQSVRLYDMAGKLLCNVDPKQSTQPFNFQFSIFNLSSGTYLLQVSYPTATLTRKIVISH